ncbi:hypothetical protein HIM_04417 [Hirsutella minnesotensis 3608]|uniref:Pleckstrin homology domain-containing protein n=1 Tax=Hirsutella minnesotensis 3608 TaxID=1043627 RepID=A0A0F7ZPZ0_9HYPO|nr:hypothetical protein HIM_04417 [Hirsutella minnesotensis 3608]
MAGWATDNEYTTGLGISCASSPLESSMRTPPANSAKPGRRSVTPPGPASSPIRVTDEQVEKAPARDATNDESISILDPRRFTPTLHANLVSEILSLRRDQEEKTSQIESLESSLHAAKEDQERLQDGLTTASKEARSLKRQLSLLEGGSSSALSELQRERDEAVESAADTKKRLEAAQRKLRNQEEDSQRVHDLWAQEKAEWEDERRKFERKVHTAESRLKLLLDEVAAYQASHVGLASHDHETDGEESGNDSDSKSVRTMSITNSIRQSLLNSPDQGLLNGHCLADELNFDDDQTDIDGRDSVLSFHASPRSPRIHRRNQSFESLRRPDSVARRRLFMRTPVMENEPQAPPKASYTDTGIQFSPPPSPQIRPVKPATPDLMIKARAVEFDSPRGDSEIEANQSRKRVSITKPLKVEPPKMDRKMVSASAQTMDEPLSPPKTPKSLDQEFVPASETLPSSMVSSSTQTEDALPAPPSSFPSKPTITVPPLPIPTINIQPPLSRPPTPRSPRLPQYSKDFGCQVNIFTVTPKSDASVQTEGIQTDKRLALLPPHLQPSAISSRPNSPHIPGAGREKNFTPVPGGLPARNPRRLTQGGEAPELPPSPINSHGDDDDLYEPYSMHDEAGAPPSSRGASMRRSRRLSSLFAGFDTASSDGLDEFGDGDLSDLEYRTALSAPKPQSKPARPFARGSFGARSRTSEELADLPPTGSMMASTHSDLKNGSTLDRESRGKRHAKRPSRTYEKSPPPPPPGSRNGAMRRNVLIQSGIASHCNRSRSPSLPESGYPPFPIPTRASSRKPSGSASGQDPGSPTRGDSLVRRGSSRSSYRSRNVRKVRSATALSHQNRHRRPGSQSPPPRPLSPSAANAEVVGLPPLPKNDITTPRNRDAGSGQFRRHRHQLSNTTDFTNNTEPVSQTSASQKPGIVDAISHTMVGEWMLKYVRRRRSFGMPEHTGKDDSSNDRHKRWVWLAPYERAILWSSKQPSSGSALMGKSGRKLKIQSVLDVKDDNPAPKVMPSVFNRSILILTPQRALKFTAVSAERHYLWLTALSFLAHSSQAVPEILATPHLKVNRQPLPEFDMPRTRFRRGGIRDSIRLAKHKSGTHKSGVPSVPSAPSSSRMGDVISFRHGEAVPTVTAGHAREQSQEAAEPPFIPRFSERAMQLTSHGRKRSNTGGHVAPPVSFRGFSGPLGGALHHASTNSTANASIGTANSEAQQSQASSNTTWNLAQTMSAPGGEASNQPKNFFDAVGTVRMEAFISPLAFTTVSEYPDEQDEFRHSIRRRSKEMRRKHSRNRTRDHFGPKIGPEELFGRARTADEDFFGEDPFKGF